VGITGKLSRKFRRVLVIVLIIHQCICLSTYAKEQCSAEELKRREQQAKLENWQHMRETEVYQSEMMIQNSPEFVAGRKLYWRAQKILKSKSQPQPKSQLQSKLDLFSSATTNSVLQSQVALPQIFYVSRKGPTDGTADGRSWKTAWPELNQIDWTIILEANNCNRLGNDMANCASVIIPADKENKSSKQTPAFLNIVEGLNDKIICASVNGGIVNAKGDLVIGKNVHQINTTGNTTILGPDIIDDHLTNDPEVDQFVLHGEHAIIPPASGAAIAGLATGTILGDGFASGYKCR
jgi:hypothetical protein